MLATLVDEPFDDKRWVFETKWDGFRLITEKRGHADLAAKGEVRPDDILEAPRKAVAAVVCAEILIRFI